MNPYQPPSSIASGRRTFPKIQRRNPARFVLYPLAAICIFLCMGMASQFLRDGFPNRTPEYLNAGTALLMGMLGGTALFLAVTSLSRMTRVLTVCWSFITLSLLATSLIFERPQSILESLGMIAVGLVLASAGLLVIWRKTLLAKNV